MITLNSPEQITRTRARIAFIGFNFLNNAATIGFIVTDNSGDNMREVQKQIGPGQFAAFVSACQISKQATEQFIADNYLPGTVS